MAATYVVPEDGVLAGKAEAIVVGSALSSHTEVTAGGRVYTVTEISVSEVIKGSPKMGRSIKVTSPGGVHGDRVNVVYGAPRFVDGERVVLFLNSAKDGRTWGTTDLGLGVFSFAVDNAGSQVLVRDEDEIVGSNTRGERHIEQRRSASRFISYLRNISAGAPANADYFVAFSPLVAKQLDRGLNNTPQENGTYTPLSYTSDAGGGVGGRWANFPTQVDWRNQNTLSNGAARSVEVIQLSLASWTNDCQSNVNYQYVGTTSNTGGLITSDNVSSVIYERNLNNIPGVSGISAYSCAGGGVIALGGWSSNTGAHSFNGQSFATITEGDVEFNQGINACPSYFNSGDFVTAAVHEFGHTLGIRHANQTRINHPGIACGTDASLNCSNTAVMNSSIIGGYNGALQTWDLAAARALYPGTCGARPNGDFNNSGHSDLLWRNQSTGQTAVWLMNGSNIASSAFISPLAPPWAVQGIGDFNGDGNADIFWRNPQTLGAAIWFMNGTTVSSGAFVATPNSDWSCMGIGDFNGNGKADILWRNSVTNEAVVWLMNGAAIDSTGSVAFPSTEWVVDGVGDFNGNSRADILWRNTNTSQSVVWLMNGAAIDNASYIATPSPQWSVKGVGDFNGDGKADLFWRNGNDFTSVIWLMNGLAIDTAAYTATANSQWQIQAVGDFNANSRADLVWRNTTTGENAMWFMNGVAIDSSTLFTPLADLNFNIAGPR